MGDGSKIQSINYNQYAFYSIILQNQLYIYIIQLKDNQHEILYSPALSCQSLSKHKVNCQIYSMV